jgi:hypothetical protein
MHIVSKIIFLLGLITCFAHTLKAAEQTPDRRPKRPRDDVTSIENTPSALQSSTTQTVEQTPGQLVSQRQAEILTKERFAAVLGEDIINSWGIEWQVFTDTTLEFDAPQKRNQLRILIDKIKKTSGYRDNPQLNFLYMSLIYIKDDMEAIHADRLDLLAIKYFTELYPAATKIESLDKQSGVQLGERIKVTFPDGNALLYHVKTHSEGRLFDKSTAPKLVNPQELLAYKILELLGFGCEVHFFEKSPEDVYIATLDASFVSKTKRGKFNVFHKAAGDLGRGNDTEYGQSIWGTLADQRRQISENTEVGAWNALEKNLQSDEIAQNFIHQQSSLDILTRIMRLCDLLNNPENFGFISCDDMHPQLKVIDFRVMDPKELVLEDSDFRGFLVGNGIYNYASSHDTMCYVLRNRPRTARVAHALHIMNTNLKNLVGVINMAHEFVFTYLQKKIFDDKRKKLEDELNNYSETLRKNTEFFKAELEDWSPEKDRAREEARQRVLNRAR